SPRWWKRLAEVLRNRAAQCLAGRDVELNMMHRAGENRAVESTHLEGRVHMAAAPVKRVVAAIGIAHHDFLVADSDKLHSARRNFIDFRHFDQHLSPL